MGILTGASEDFTLSLGPADPPRKFRNLLIRPKIPLF